MELLFLALLIVLMATALASGFPVAFALPGSAIVTVLIAAGVGLLVTGESGAFFAQGDPGEWLSAGVTNFRGVYWEVERDTLIAIPLFVFMGIMLQRSQIAEDLLVTMAQLFGPIPGGLGISVVFVGALLAATTGILGATVVAMGLISLPAMQRNRYSMPLSTGTIAASGTLGQIIPPSIVLIILADQLASATDQAGAGRRTLYKQMTGELSLPSEFGVTSTSAGDMFMGALGPGLVMVGLYMLFILVAALIRPSLAPAVPMQDKLDRHMFLKVLLILVPPLTLIFVVLGSIITGVATVNQAGAIGAIGATVMAGYRLKAGKRGAFYPSALAVVSLVALGIITANYDTNVKNIQTDDDVTGVTLAAIATGLFVISVLWSLLRTLRINDTLNGVMIETAKTTSLVFIILLGAAMLTAAFRAFGGEELVREFLTGLTGGFWAQFVIVMAVIFLLGFFLDFIEIAVVVVPIIAPILLLDPGANITAVWLGVMIGLNIQTSFLTPPFGFALFYLRGVAPPDVRTTQIYKGVVPFIMLQLVALGIVGSYPPLVNYLPSRISLTSETAPPPTNPMLRHCLDKYLIAQYEAEGDALRAAIERAQALPLDALPDQAARELEDAFDTAEEVFEAREAVVSAAAAVQEATPDYKPLHLQVRRLQRDIAKIDEQLVETRDNLEDLDFMENPPPGRRSELEERISELENERARLKEQIPDRWEREHAAFAKLMDAEERARRQFRRLGDDAYEPVRATIDRLGAVDELRAARQNLSDLVPEIESMDPDALDDRLKEVGGVASDADAASDIGRALRRARRLLRRDSPDYDRVERYLEVAIEGLAEDIERRRGAAKELLPGLRRYEAAIRGTMGVRAQDRLPEEPAIFVASCNAEHRDISLHF